MGNRQAVQGMLEDLVGGVMDRMALEERKSMQEKKRKEWRENWEALELEIAMEMDILMELEPEAMDTQDAATTTTAGVDMEVYEEQEMDVEYQLEDNGYDTYEEWLMQELEEMGIIWDH